MIFAPNWVVSAPEHRPPAAFVARAAGAAASAARPAREPGAAAGGRVSDVELKDGSYIDR